MINITYFAGPINIEFPLWITIPIIVMFLIAYAIAGVMSVLFAKFGFDFLKAIKLRNREAAASNGRYSPVNILISYITGLITEAFLMLVSCQIVLTVLTSNNVKLFGYDYGSRSGMLAGDQEIFIAGIFLLVLIRTAVRIVAGRLLFDNMMGIRKLSIPWKYGFILLDIMLLLAGLQYIQSLPS